MKQLFTSLCIIISLFTAAQQKQAENIIIVTLDGYRWQEVFGGADETLINDSTYVHDREELKNKFWAANKDERRKKLMPFFWNTIAAEGQLYGNRWEGNLVNNANKYWFSYPGYNEIFTGYPDDSVNSNDKIYNANTNVLEFLNQQKEYKNKVAAFSTWDVFPYILNNKRSGVFVNADVDTLRFNNKQLQLINDMQFLTTRPIGVRPDVFTYFAAREYLKAYQPKVLYIAFDETDDFAHGGMYDQYLMSAHAEDGMIADLWHTIQQMPAYKNKTTLIITCDHGRGDAIKKEWRHHGSDIKDAGQIWVAAIGAGVSPRGEVKEKGQLYQAQIAQTIAHVLGYTFKAAHPVQPAISSILQYPSK